MRSLNKSTFVVGSLLASLFAFSCASDQPTNDSSVGKVGLAITVGATNINSVRFQISGNSYGAPGAGTNKVDNVNVTNSHTASAQIGGIPAGTNYALDLLADSDADGNDATGTHCTGHSTFNVVAGKVSRTTMTLSCHLEDGSITHPTVSNGSVNVAANVVTTGGNASDVCPVINSVSMMPSEVAVGQDIVLVANATDPDTSTLTYVWTETSANAAFPTITTTNGTTTFHCVAAGNYSLRLTVSDGVAACDATLATVDGTPSGTEQIISCTLPAINNTSTGGQPGTGGAATGGVAPTGGVAATGGAATGGVAPTGGVAATGGAATGGVAPTGGVAATGGAATGGVAPTGGVAATGGAPTPPSSPIPAILTYWGSANCQACAAENCASPDSTVGADVYSPTGESCDQLTGADAALCYAVLTCELQSDCTTVSGQAVTPCYCGTSTNCIGGVGVNGACKAQIEAGLRSTDASFIAGNFGATSLPGGRANALMQCAVNGIQYGGPNFTGDARCSSCFSATPAN